MGGVISSTGTWKRSDWIAAISAVISLLALLITAAPYAHDYLTTTTAQFGQPLDGSTTNAGEIATSGTVDNPPPADQDIWLVVRPRTQGRWYPVERLRLQPEETFSTPAADTRLGPAGEYQLYLFLTDSVASSGMQDYVTANLSNPDPPGMGAPPPGSVLLDVASIQRTDG